MSVPAPWTVLRSDDGDSIVVPEGTPVATAGFVRRRSAPKIKFVHRVSARRGATA